MTGSPRKRVMLQRLDALTADAFPDTPSATHLDFVELWQASGGLLNTLADSLSDPDPNDPARRVVSGSMVMNHLKSTFGSDQVHDRLTRAREEGAHRLADESVSIADEADPDNVNVARLRAAVRQWTAEKWNPREFGRHQNVQVGISVTHLHLAALQSPKTLQATVIRDASTTPPLSSITQAPNEAIAEVLTPHILASPMGAQETHKGDKVNLEGAEATQVQQPHIPRPRPAARQRKPGAKARRPPP